MRCVPLILFSLTFGQDLLAHGGIYRGRPGGRTTDSGSNPSITGGLSGGAATDDRWELWWGHNREAYLQRATLSETPTVTESAGFFTGRGTTASKDRIDELRALRIGILPELVRALSDSSLEVADSAAIAVARAAMGLGPEEIAPYRDALLQTVSHPERSPQESAVLSLGILRDGRSGRELNELLLASTQGRKLASGAVSDMVRSNAALSLGLLNDPSSVEPLLRVCRDRSTPRPVAAACVLSLGMHDSAVSLSLQGLLGLLEEADLDREVRAQVPVAIQRLPAFASRTALARMVKIVEDDRGPNELRRSAAIALGGLAAVEDREAVQMLQRSLTDPDVMVRSFACISLGRIGERFSRSDRLSAESLVPLAAIHEELLRRLRSPAYKNLRPFAAIALGLFSRGVRERSLCELTGTKLKETFREESNPSLQGAIAIAAGLMKASELGDDLLRRLESTQDAALRGHLVTALGMLLDQASVEPLRKLIATHGLPPSLQLETARSLALLRDPTLVPTLIAVLRDADDLNQASAAAKALGITGDPSAAQPLLKLARKRSDPDLRRAFSIVALGLLADADVLPWNARYSIDSNYLLQHRPLVEMFSIL